MITRALGVALVASFAVCGLQTWRLDNAQDSLREVKLQIAEHTAAAERKARELEQEFAANARKAAQNYATQTNRVRADADAARSELDRLRDTVTAANPYAAEGAASAARTDAAKRLAVVVNECAAALSTVARDADATSAKLIGLQEYVRGLTAPDRYLSNTAPER